MFEEIYEIMYIIMCLMDEIVWVINLKFDDLESFVYYLIIYV